jgi:hypothetical protein
VQNYVEFGNFKSNDDWKIEKKDHPLFKGDFRLNNRDDNHIMKFTIIDNGDDVEYPAMVVPANEPMVAIRYSQPGLLTQIAHICHQGVSKERDVESCIFLVNACALYKFA